MSTHADHDARVLSSPRPRWRRWQRVLGWGLGVVLGLAALLNLALNTGLVPALVHQVSPRTKVGWSRAWWLWPGHAHARGFFVEQRDARVRWRIDADFVRARLFVAALFNRRFAVEEGLIRGVRIQVDPLPPEEWTPPKPPASEPWQVELRGLHFQDARELAWGTTRYLGPADARGTVYVVVGHYVTVEGAHLYLAGGFVEVQGQRAARMEELSTDFSLQASRKGPDGWEVLGGLSGRLQAKADLLPLDWLGARLSRHAEVSLQEGAGVVEVDWSGTFSLPQATLTLSPLALEAHFSGTFANADPFVALFASRKKLPHFFTPLLQTRDLQVRGRVQIGDTGLQVRELHASAGNIRLQGRVALSRGNTHVLILAVVNESAGGVEVTSKGIHFHLKDAQSWYEQQLAVPLP